MTSPCMSLTRQMNLIVTFRKGTPAGVLLFCGGVRRTPPNYCTPPARKNQEKIGEWTRHRIIPKPQVRALFDQLWRNCEEKYFLKKCLTIRANESIILNVRRGKRKTLRGWSVKSLRANGNSHSPPKIFSKKCLIILALFDILLSQGWERNSPTTSRKAERRLHYGYQERTPCYDYHWRRGNPPDQRYNDGARNCRTPRGWRVCRGYRQGWAAPCPADQEG